MTTEEQALVCEWLGIPKLGPWLPEGYPNLLDWAGFGLMVEGLIKANVAPETRWWAEEFRVFLAPLKLRIDGVSGYAPTLPEALAQAVLALARKDRG